LFSQEEWDAREILRSDEIDGSDLDEALADLVRASIGAKRAGHGIDSEQFVKPARAMYQIGG
jgi:cyclic pyranopterin phosphate synthase